MHTISGKRFELGTTYAPSIQDVAIGLSRIPRWAGATVRPWSVLQHSLATATLAASRGAADLLEGRGIAIPGGDAPPGLR